MPFTTMGNWSRSHWRTLGDKTEHISEFSPPRDWIWDIKPPTPHYHCWRATPGSLSFQHSQHGLDVLPQLGVGNPLRQNCGLFRKKLYLHRGECQLDVGANGVCCDDFADIHPTSVYVLWTVIPTTKAWLNY